MPPLPLFGKRIISLINQYKAAIKGQADAERQYMEAPDAFKKQLEGYQAQANLRDKLIDIQFVSKLKAENEVSYQIEFES